MIFLQLLQSLLGAPWRPPWLSRFDILELQRFKLRAEGYLKARIDESGQLGFVMGGLREKICRTCYLPPGSDITLVYIDEDGDVVTLVDDDDLQEAMRQRLKSFRIDVLMNDTKVYRKSSSDNKVRRNSSSRSTQVMMDHVGSSLGTSDDNMELKKASTSSYATRDYGYKLGHFFHECSFIAAAPVNPPVVCFKGSYLEDRWYAASNRS